jgi:GNAT superfamily N-acetyltransferase
MIEASDVESRRFGVVVGRAVVDDTTVDEMLPELAMFDVVIVRSAAECRRVPQRLAGLAHHRLLPADHLMYWECERSAAVPLPSMPTGWTIDAPTDVSEVVAVVRDSFDRYDSHYAVNPLFDAADVLDGYCEWAAGLYASSQVWTRAMYDDRRRAVGVALVDHSTATPDVRLAGMVPGAQGRGLYSALLGAISRLAATSGAPRIQISTQSTNTRVMRAWARSGFRPISTLATCHLVRSELLEAATDDRRRR